MSPENPARGLRRRRVFQVERLETRELLTFTLSHQGTSFSPAVLLAIQAADAARAAQSQAPPPTPSGTGIPSAHELIRQTYIGKFVGSYTVGAGRFSDQASQIYTLGSGTSNQSLHGQYQMRVSVPKDPKASIGGVIALFGTNVATTGSTLILDLTADPKSLVRGLPTRYTWTVSPSSAGLYTNAGGFGDGQGTLDIHFIPGGNRVPSVLAAGRTTVVIKGLINVGGVFNDLGVPGAIAKHP